MEKHLILSSKLFQSYFLFAQMAKQHPDPAINQLTVDYAGIYPSLEVDPELYPALEKLGVPTTTHIPKKVTIDLIEAADLVLTMTKIHKRFVQELAPHAVDKVHLFREYVGKSGDIMDQVATGISAYVKMGKEFQTLIKQLFEKVLEQ